MQLTLFQEKETQHCSQQKRILRLLQDNINYEVPLNKILDLHIGQYNARIKELRVKLKSQGLCIENRTEMVKGIKHSYYSLKAV